MFLTKLIRSQYCKNLLNLDIGKFNGRSTQITSRIEIFEKNSSFTLKITRRQTRENSVITYEYSNLNYFPFTTTPNSHREESGLTTNFLLLLLVQTRV